MKWGGGKVAWILLSATKHSSENVKPAILNTTPSRYPWWQNCTVLPEAGVLAARQRELWSQPDGDNWAFQACFPLKVTEPMSGEEQRISDTVPLGLRPGLPWSHVGWGEGPSFRLWLLERNLQFCPVGLDSGCPCRVQTQTLSRQKSVGNGACLVLPQGKMNCCMSQGADAEVGKDGEQNKEVDSVFGKLSYFIRASMSLAGKCTPSGVVRTLLFQQQSLTF